MNRSPVTGTSVREAWGYETVPHQEAQRVIREAEAEEKER